MDIITPIVKHFITHALDRLSRAGHTDTSSVEDRVAQHLTDVVSWSENIQFLGMAVPHATESVTIPLPLDVGSRRFQGVSGEELSELDLLMTPGSYAILGDPGSGKTTTLKRLAGQLLREPEDASDTYQFPIVIRLRDLAGKDTSSSTSLMTAIADVLGIQYRWEKKTIRRFGGEVGSVVRARVGHHLLSDVLPDVISSAGAVLLIDGLDEAADLLGVLTDLETLVRRLPQGKLIFTCRAGEYNRQIEGVRVASLRPLGDTESRAIAAAWLGNVDAELFRMELLRLPYSDVADRPLMLCQLLFLFKRNGHLPDQQASVYRRLTNLLLHDWDAERGIERRSAYAAFLPERKAEFLAALSYQLTYRLNTRTFTSMQLMAAYEVIHDGFRLPKNQAAEVARELETHTGLIVEISHGRYEFSHLSLQEFLCADYMVREPVVELLDEYAAQYPAPLAIAVSLSSAPSAWFTELVLKHIAPSFSPASVAAFLARLIVERPTFANSPALGMALLYLLSRYAVDDHANIHEQIRVLIDTNKLAPSMQAALVWYVIEPTLTEASDHVFFTKRMGILDRYGIKAPESLRIPKSLIRAIVPNSKHAVVWRKQDSVLETVTGREAWWDETS